MDYLTSIKYWLVILSFFTINNIVLGHNIDYTENIVNSTSILEKNTSYNIEKSKLLKSYIDNLQKEITNFKTDYYVQSEDLNSKSFELTIMSQGLGKIQTINIERHHAESVYESIIEKIKTLKTEISVTLKKEHTASLIQLAQNKQETNKKAQIVSQRFIGFVNIFTPKVRNLQNSERKNLILTSITAINIEASKLALFSTKDFSSQRQLDDYYSNSLRSIKRELQKIQAVILNK